MEAAAAIVGLIAVGAQISSVIQQFLSSCANAPALAQTIHSEIHAFSFVLSKLQPIVLGTVPSNSSRASLIDVDQLSFTLTGCVCTFSELEKEINSLKLKYKMDLWDRIKWSRTEPTISQLIQQLQYHKLSLNLILTIFVSESPAEATSCRHCLNEQLAKGAPVIPSLGQLGVPSPGTEVPGDHSSINSVLDLAAGGPSSILDDDSSLILENDSSSIITATGSRREGLYRLAFESTLFISRPYRGISNDSMISLASSKRPKGSWSRFSGRSNSSVYSLPVSMLRGVLGDPNSSSVSLPVSMGESSGITLAEAPSMSAISLPISPSQLYNPAWYNTNSPNVLSLDQVLLGRTSPITAIGESARSLSVFSVAKTGQKRFVQLVLGSRAEKEEKNISNTKLHLAAMNGDKTKVQLLLDRGADKEAKNGNGRTPLSLAAYFGHQATVQLLLDRGADKEAKDNMGRTPLGVVAIEGHQATVQLLLDRGADKEAKDGNGRTPLSLAAYFGNQATVQLLLDRGADKEAKDGNGRTPLSLAALKGHQATVRLLLDRGADKEAKDGNGRTPLSLAAYFGHQATVQLLLDRGADKEAKDNNEDTPLSLAAYFGHQATVQLLLDRGADKEAKDGNGRTPLSLAAYSGHQATVQLLLDRGADIEAEDSHRSTPLVLAAYNGYHATIQLLIDAGAEKDAKDNDWDTTLHEAARQGHNRIVKILLDQGADKEIKNKKGNTPLDEAMANSHQAAIQLLLDRRTGIGLEDLDKGAETETNGKSERSLRSNSSTEYEDEQHVDRLFGSKMA